MNIVAIDVVWIYGSPRLAITQHGDTMWYFSNFYWHSFHDLWWYNLASQLRDENGLIYVQMMIWDPNTSIHVHIYIYTYIPWSRETSYTQWIFPSNSSPFSNRNTKTPIYKINIIQTEDTGGYWICQHNKTVKTKEFSRDWTNRHPNRNLWRCIMATDNQPVRYIGPLRP